LSRRTPEAVIRPGPRLRRLLPQSCVGGRATARKRRKARIAREANEEEAEQEEKDRRRAERRRRLRIKAKDTYGTADDEFGTIQPTTGE
jgi:hypothetical protein